MPGSNQFLPFATGGGANVLTPTAYAALTTLLASGFQAGVAPSQQLNTVWRQSSFVASAIAQAIADQTGAAVADDGVIANFEAQFLHMLQQAPYVAAHAGGTADALTASFTPAITTLTESVLWIRAASANATTTPTFTPNSGVIAAHTIVKGAGSALAPGDIAGAGHWLCLQYDTTLTAWVLLNPAKGVGGQAAFLNLVQTFTKAQRSAVTALTDAATINVDFSLSNDFSVTLGGNRTLTFTNAVEGQSGTIFVSQDATGGRTLAYTGFKFYGGVAPTLTTAANAVDHLHYKVGPGGLVTLTIGRNSA